MKPAVKQYDKSLLPRITRVLFAFALLVLLPAIIKTQSYSPTSRTPGTPSGSYKLSEFDTVNLFSGNLNFNMPLLNVGGRGDPRATLQLVIENQWGFREHQQPGMPPGSYLYDYYIDSPQTSLTGIGSLYFETQSVEDPPPNCLPDGYTRYRTTYHNLTYVEPDGTEHVLRDRNLHGMPYWGCGPFGPDLGRIFESTDGSFVTFVSDTNINIMGAGAYGNGYLYFRNGTKSRVENWKFIWTQDRNGNKLEYFYDPNGDIRIKDSLGREVKIEHLVTESAPYGLCHRITYKGFGGEDKILRISVGTGNSYLRTTQPGDSSTMKLKSELFDLSPDQVYPSDHYVHPGGFTALWLPDGRSYKFFYNVYNQLARVELPTGGAVEYDFAIPYIGLGLGTKNRVTQKRVYDVNNVLVAKTVFSVVQVGPPEIVSVEQFDAAGNRLTKSLHYFNGTPDNGLGSIVSWEIGREFKTESYDSNGTSLLRRTERDWVQRPRPWCSSPCPSISNNPFLVETRDLIVDGNLVSKTSSVNPVDGSWAYDTFNNPTDVWNYDFGVGSAGPVLKHTQMSYLNYFDPLADKHLLGLPSTTSVYAVGSSGQETLASSTQIVYDEYAQYPLLTYGAVTGWQDPGVIRGNPTTVKQWLNTNNSWISTNAQFDQLGNSRKSWDPLGRLSETIYTDSFSDSINRSTYAFATQTISPIPDPDGGHGHGATSSFVTSSVYDFSSGLLKSATDLNGQTTNLEYSDPLNRLKKVTNPNGAWIEYHYGDTIGNLHVKTRAAFDESRILESYSFFDGLGRTVRTAKLDGEGTWITVDTQFDSLGRFWRTSNPYHAAGLYGAVNPSNVWTINQYDALSRPVSVTAADGTQTFTTYSGSSATGQDAAGKKRKTVADALGRMIQVVEDPTGLNFVTNYTHDVLGNLRVIEQGNQRRYYMYDSLSRLVRSKNPEQASNVNLAVYDPITDNSQWAIGFEHAANGNVLTRTDPRGIRTEYSYDNLNRVYKRHFVTTLTPPAGTYTATPDDEYFYDGKGFVTPPNFSLGKVTKVYSTNSETRNTQFDLMGRLLASEQETDGNVYQMSYSYNLSGALVSQTYPSLKEVKNLYDNAGELSNVSGRIPTTPYKMYATNFDYDFTSTGAQNQMQLGNGRWESTLFNKCLQSVQTGLGSTQNATNLLKLEYNYGANNNGNLQSQTITVPTVGQNAGFVAVQSYTYDGLNRLEIASETSNGGPSWQQTFDYDRFGNRQVTQGTTTTSLIGDNPLVSEVDNRITPQTGEQYLYDPAGNVIRDKVGNLYAYNGESQQTTFTPVGSSQPTATYTYDSDGRRIKKVSGNETTIFVYNALGQMVEEYSINTPVPPVPTTSYLTTDNLGTPRINTDSVGNVQARHDYLPFGEEVGAFGGRGSHAEYRADSIRQRFTGYQRDTESGLDFAQARYYASGSGRFTGVDPLMASANTVNPQTFNRYAYVLNNPYRYVDPSGLDSSGLDDQTDQAFGHLGELVDNAMAETMAREDAAREEAKKKKKEQQAGQTGQNQQQTGPANNQQGQAPTNQDPPPQSMLSEAINRIQRVRVVQEGQTGGTPGIAAFDENTNTEVTNALGAAYRAGVEVGATAATTSGVTVLSSISTDQSTSVGPSISIPGAPSVSGSESSGMSRTREVMSAEALKKDAAARASNASIVDSTATRLDGVRLNVNTANGVEKATATRAFWKEALSREADLIYRRGVVVGSATANRSPAIAPTR